jgi:predicted phage-related endonuclease
MAYSDRTGRQVEWFDETVAHPDRSWQVCTPDAWVLENCRKAGGMDSKTVAWDQRHAWGEDMDTVPAHIVCQCQWSCSTTELPWWDVAACFGLDDIRIYRVERDPKIEAVLLEEVDRFWRENVLARVAPPIGGNEDAKEYLRQAFPTHHEPLRSATAEEEALILRFIAAKAAAKETETLEAELGNQLKLAIGDSEGIQARVGRATWRKDKDSVGTDWEAIAREYASRIDLLVGRVPACVDLPWDCGETVDQMAARIQRVTRVGPRKLLVK